MQPMNAVVLTLILGMPSFSGATIDPWVQQRLSALAVPFVPNNGQWDQQAVFAAKTFAGILFVTSEGKLVYRLRGKAAPHDDKPVAAWSRRSTVRTTGMAENSAEGELPGWVLTETLAVC